MKAQELLHRYSAGERSFCNTDLRGANFKEKDLSGADFSGSNIRSADFTDAVLRNANFTKTQGGLQRRWILVQLAIIVLLAGFSGMLQGFASAIIASFFNSSTENIIAGCVYLAILVIVFVSIAFYGFTLRALAVILIGTAIAFAGAFAGAGLFAVANVTAGAVAGAFAFTVAVAIAVAGTFSGAGILAVAVAVFSALASAFAVAFIVAGSFAVAVESIGALTTLLLSIYVARQVIKENEKFAIAQVFGLTLGVLGGTSFCGADLSQVTFSGANLQNANFTNSRHRATTFTHVSWRGANRLNRARLGSSILKDRRVLKLLTTPEKGYKQNLEKADLRGANLTGVTLEGANLKQTILSYATLENAVLKDAILTESQAVNADFTGACLTGVTLEAWNIDRTTTFKNIDCQYVFLREHPDEKGNRERRPHNPDKVFQPGDFEKLFKEVLDEVQILIRNGVNAEAFRTAFKKIMEEIPGITGDSVKALEKKREDILLTLEVPGGTDKGKVESIWNSTYQARLTEIEENYKELRAAVEQQSDDSSHSSYLASLDTMSAMNTGLMKITELLVSNPMNSEIHQTFNAPVGNATGSNHGSMSAIQNNYGSSVEDITRLIALIHSQIQVFPSEHKDDALDVLIALETEVEKAEPDLSRISRWLKKLLSAGSVAAAIAGGAATFSGNLTEFTSNVSELANTLGIPIEQIQPSETPEP